MLSYFELSSTETLIFILNCDIINHKSCSESNVFTYKYYMTFPRVHFHLGEFEENNLIELLIPMSRELS